MSSVQSEVHSTVTSPFSAQLSLGPENRAVKCPHHRTECDSFVCQLAFNLSPEQDRDRGFGLLPTESLAVTVLILQTTMVREFISCKALCKQKQFHFQRADSLKPLSNSLVGLEVICLSLP